MTTPRVRRGPGLETGVEYRQVERVAARRELGLEDLGCQLLMIPDRSSVGEASIKVRSGRALDREVGTEEREAEGDLPDRNLVAQEPAR